MAVLLLRLIKSHEHGNLTIPSDAIINNAAMYEANKLTKGMGNPCRICQYKPSHRPARHGMGCHVFIY